MATAKISPSTSHVELKKFELNFFFQQELLEKFTYP